MARVLSKTLIPALALAMALTSAGVGVAETSIKDVTCVISPSVAARATAAGRPSQQAEVEAELKVEFTSQMERFEAKRVFVILPPASVDWRGASFAGGSSLVVRGTFQLGVDYKLILTRALKAEYGKEEVSPGEYPFKVMVEEGRIKLLGTGSVVERNSRQFVHLEVKNLQKVALELTRVPVHVLVESLQEPEPKPKEGEKENRRSDQDDEEETVDEDEPRERAEAPKPSIELPERGIGPERLSLWNGRAAAIAGAATASFGDLFARKATVESEPFQVPVPEGRVRETSLPLRWGDGARNGGTFVLRARALGTAAEVTSKSRLVQITNLGLSYKASGADVLVWVTQLESGEPVAGAKVFFGSVDKRLVSAGETNADGVLHVLAGTDLPGLDLSSSSAGASTVPFTPAKARRLIVATADDLAWADLDRNLLKLPRQLRPPADQAKDGPAAYAHVFTERGIYRPGEQVGFKVTVREFQGGVGTPPAPGSPWRRCRLIIKDPKNKESRELPLDLSDFGTASGRIPIRVHDPLGQWTIRVRGVGGKRNLGETTFQIAEFVAPRHKVDVTFSEGSSSVPGSKRFEPDKTIVATVRGTYYAGGPVKHGRVRWQLFLDKTSFPLSSVKGYSAGTDLGSGAAGQHRSRRRGGYAAGSDLSGESTGELIESGETVLGEDGALDLEIPKSGEVARGQRSLSIVAWIVDFDGRVATGNGNYAAEPDFLVGLAEHPTDLEVGETVDLAAVVVERASGKTVSSGEVTAELLGLRDTSVLKRNEEGDFFWEWNRVMVRLSEAKVPIRDGAAAIRWPLSDGGKYQVRVSFTAPDGTVYSSTTTYNSQWKDSSGDWTDYRWEASDTPTVSVRADRLEYLPGEVARLRLAASRAVASYLVTVERERVLTYRRVVLRSSEERVELPIQDSYLPGVAVSVLGVHPRTSFPIYASEADTGAPGYSHGYLIVPVRRAHTGLQVDLAGVGATVTREPGQRHRVDLAVVDADGKPVRASVALAVVDEAVLALTKYENPTLDKLFDRILPLAVRTGDFRSWLLHQSPYHCVRVRPVTGGDGDAAGKAVKTRERFDPTAFFEPDIVTDEKGQARVEFTLPDTITAYRVYALALDRTDRHGAAASSFVVKKPFYLELGMPRFFSNEDRGRFSVALFNSTGEDQEATVSIEGTGALRLTIPQPTVRVKAGDRVEVPVEFQALSPGRARVRAQVHAGAHADAVALEIPVRPRHVTRTQAVDGVLTAPRDRIQLALLPEASGLTPEALKLAGAQLEISTLPALKLVGGLRWLLNYPFGCVEQTSSVVLPLAGMRDLVRQGLFPTIKMDQLDRTIAAGVERLLTMQTSSGGFGYWPGYSEPHPWGSAYAMLALTVAARAGVAVPDPEFERGLEYLGSLEDQPEAVRALATYVTGLNRRSIQDAAGILGRSTSSRESRLLALLATHAAGDRDTARPAMEAYLASNVSTLDAAEEFDSNTFYVNERARAIELLTLLELAPRHERIERLAVRLARDMGTQGFWSTTQANAWALLALGRYAGRLRPSGSPLSVNVSGGGLSPTAAELPSHGSHAIALASPFFQAPAVELSRAGTVPLFWRLEATYPWRGADVNTADAPIRRTYRRLAGDGEIRVGDLVEVSLQFDLPRALDYLALNDPLPAGLVAINTAIKAEEPVEPKSAHVTGWSPDGRWVCPFVPSRVEVRSDRVLAFKEYGWKGRYRFDYVARAVCQGRFAVPPAQVEPMYSSHDSIYSASADLEVVAAK
ncbi:MAG: hypothetical protein HY815_16150 [Candidatus Riflebacteria bacterium]|nr:hypothetical protein [Candidatus Riflebacteria bacterium]